MKPTQWNDVTQECTVIVGECIRHEGHSTLNPPYRYNMKRVGDSKYVTVEKEVEIVLQTHTFRTGDCVITSANGFGVVGIPMINYPDARSVHLLDGTVWLIHVNRLAHDLNFQIGDHVRFETPGIVSQMRNKKGVISSMRLATPGFAQCEGELNGTYDLRYLVKIKPET